MTNCVVCFVSKCQVVSDNKRVGSIIMNRSGVHNGIQKGRGLFPFVLLCAPGRIQKEKGGIQRGEIKQDRTTLHNNIITN